MNVEERLNRARFRKVNKDNETCCALCNYYTVTDDTHEDACELHRVNFGKNFDAWCHECTAVDCSRWDNLVNGILEEQKEEEKAASISQKQESQQSSQKEGCYIATAVYGSYDAPEVLILRKFRDNVLKKSRGGRMFIKIYYTLSPGLAEKLKDYTFINNKVRAILDRMVILIKKRSVD